MQRFDLIVFDWDGTIVDSTAMIAQCIQSAASDLELEVPTLERASHVIGLGLRDALLHAVPGLAEHRAEEFSARFRHHYLAGEPDIVLFPGVEQMLDELATTGIPLAVATGKARRGLARAFEATGLGHRFAASRCADESRSKPDPAMLLELADQLAVQPNQILMVGDTSHDLQMARAAGASGLGVTYGAHMHAHLSSYAPLALVDSVAELSTWLKANLFVADRLPTGSKGAR